MDAKNHGLIRMSVATGTQLMVKSLSGLYRKPLTRPRARSSSDLALSSIRRSVSKAVVTIDDRNIIIYQQCTHR